MLLLITHRLHYCLKENTITTTYTISNTNSAATTTSVTSTSAISTTNLATISASTTSATTYNTSAPTNNDLFQISGAGV